MHIKTTLREEKAMANNKTNYLQKTLQKILV